MNDGRASSASVDRRDRRARRRRLWKAPSLAWAGLMALFAASLALAYLPLGRGNLAVSLAIAGLMIALLSTFLMDLRNAKTLIRIVAGAGLFWTSLMFVLTFCDFLSRHY